MLPNSTIFNFLLRVLNAFILNNNQAITKLKGKKKALSVNSKPLPLINQLD